MIISISAMIPIPEVVTVVFAAYDPIPIDEIGRVGSLSFTPIEHSRSMNNGRGSLLPSDRSIILTSCKTKCKYRCRSSCGSVDPIYLEAVIYPITGIEPSPSPRSDPYPVALLVSYPSVADPIRDKDPELGLG